MTPTHILAAWPESYQFGWEAVLTLIILAVVIITGFWPNRK